MRRRAAVDYDAQAARRRRRTFAVLKIALPIALPVLLFAGLVKLAASRPPRSDFRW
ncbi:MAG: hypothetical protein GIW95_01370 [Candidatus Eremiobacteraeota bacterium]|nr:hypothetical protein [Candidatus Eremiobacteraeota bacterium]